MGKLGVMLSALGGFSVGGLAGAVAGAKTGRNTEDGLIGVIVLGGAGALIGTLVGLGFSVPEDPKGSSSSPGPGKQTGAGALPTQINPQVSPGASR